MVRLRHERPRKVLANRLQQPAGVAVQVAERIAQAEVAQDARDGRTQALLRRIVAAVGRRIGVDVLGRQRRAHEQEIVVIVAAVQDPAAHRVEEALRKLGLAVLGQQADVVQLDLLPDRVREAGPC